MAAEKKTRGKKTGKQRQKRNAEEVQSESEDASSSVDTDSLLPLEVLNCIMMETH